MSARKLKIKAPVTVRMPGRSSTLLSHCLQGLPQESDDLVGAYTPTNFVPLAAGWSMRASRSSFVNFVVSDDLDLNVATGAGSSLWPTVGVKAVLFAALFTVEHRPVVTAVNL